MRSRLEDVLSGWGYVDQRQHKELGNALATVLLLAGSARLEDVTVTHLTDARRLAPPVPLRSQCLRLSRALAHLGLLDESLPLHPEGHPFLRGDPMYKAGVPSEWLGYAEHWRDLTPKRPTAKRMEFSCVLAAGRWLAHAHRDVTSPRQWTRTLAAEYVAAVDKATVGGWSANPKKVSSGTFGKPFKPRSKAGYLAALRGFFCDLQEWGLAEIHFDVRRALSVPKPIQQLIGPDPRIIDETFWAKLLQAGLSLTDEDVRSTGHNYPAAMVRAIAIVWLFCGIRRDEIRRLRVGCLRRQTRDARVPASDEVLPRGTVAFLDVPPNKTTAAYTKPVDPVVADVIDVWERARPAQPVILDATAGAMVQDLFANRGRMIGMAFLNATLIPLLCRRAGIPEADARGKLTSHRARSTMASMLGNAKEPMTLLELQQWLGHRWPSSTQHYFQILPTKLGRAYADADYFRRNVRTVDVLIDEQAVISGAAAQGAPWKYFDLGHGLCLNPFYEQCAHRMACARCPLYRPKPSTLEANAEGTAHLTRMTRMHQVLNLTDDEFAAVTEGAELLQALVERLKDVPTPAGLTPRQLQSRR
jgi:integrase